MQVGDSVQVRAYKSDGTCYRWWCATIEAVEIDKVVVITPVGHWVEDIRGAWESEHAIRTYYTAKGWPPNNRLTAATAENRLSAASRCCRPLVAIASEQQATAKRRLY